jgi:hypothetical protein
MLTYWISLINQTITRRAANRRSALESRQRRKVLIEDLQKQVAVLTKETTELRAINDTLRVQLDSSLSENQQLRLIISQQQFGGGGGLPGSMAGGHSAAMLLGGGSRGGGFGGLGGAAAGIFGGLGGPSSSLLGHGAYGGFGTQDQGGGHGGKLTSFVSHGLGEGGDHGPLARLAGTGHLGGFLDMNGNGENEALAERARLINELSRKYPPV